MDMNEMPSWLLMLTLAVVIAYAADRLWPTVFGAYEHRRVARNRADLAAAGLTPARYMATISPTDYQGYAEAVQQFWPRRTRQARRDATLDRIGAAVGPLAAKEVRDLKASAHQLD